MLWRFRENSRLTEHLIHEGIVKRQISLARLDIRNWCIVAVTLSTFLSVAAIVFGVLIVFHTQSLPGFLEGKCAETNLQQISWTGIDNYVLQHFAFGSTRLASLIILLVINIVLTCLLDAHNRIDSVAFLWLLRRESTRKPRYNCNPRFFTGTRRFGKSKATVRQYIQALTEYQAHATGQLISLQLSRWRFATAVQQPWSHR
jgi:hypothetical protein